jgi:hypothetical protein
MLPDNQRAGFFIGDGAGVGKGRTIAGAAPSSAMATVFIEPDYPPGLTQWHGCH